MSCRNELSFCVCVCCFMVDSGNLITFVFYFFFFGVSCHCWCEKIFWDVVNDFFIIYAEEH